MTLDQSLSFAVIIGMMALFAWGKLRYDLVALLALLASLLVGIVPADKAFGGFSDDIVVIVGSALVVSAAVARSGVIERAVRWLGPYLTTLNRQIVALVGSVTLLSAFVKNIGALAMLMPIAFQLARRTGASPSSLLMPMSFGALLGGTMTLVGTSPNIIVSRMREEILGQPFGMFDFTPVGAGLAVAGVAFLVFGWRLLPRDRKGAVTMDAAFNLEGYTTEVEVPEEGQLIRFSFVSESPELAARIANGLADGFIDSGLQRRYDASAHARNFLQQQIAKTRADDFKAEIAHIEDALSGSVKSSPISLERGLATMMVIAAAFKSSQTGRRVSIDWKSGYRPDALR